jgi:hypothetical protein
MHFGEQIWIDFVRGLLPREEAEAISAHLASGCASCQEAHGLWSKVWTAACREHGYEPPQAAVLAAKATFILRQRASLLGRLAEVAQKIFDSFTEPLPAGIRGTAYGPRYLLHQAGSFLIDFRLEDDGGSQNSLTGQVLDSQGETATAHTGIVLLNAADHVTAQTIANSFGEFQLEFKAEPNLKLRLALHDGTVLALDLPDSDEAPT